VGNISGPRRIDQICSIYDFLVNGWIYVEDWKGLEQLQYSNYTLKKGKEAGQLGKGDCDDFSILLAALMESVGATSRIIFADRPTGGHAYAEVYLGKAEGEGSDVDRMIKWLRSHYRSSEIMTHTDMPTGDVWLNMDWWKEPGGAEHPGGPLFKASIQTSVYPDNFDDASPLTPINERPIIRELISDKNSPLIPGSAVEWNAIAEDPEGDQIYYKFFLNGNNRTDWINRSSWEWRVNESVSGRNSDLGTNEIEVHVRDDNHAGKEGFDGRMSCKFAIVSAPNPLRIRSTTASGNISSWNPQNFAAFYYDIDENLGNENLTMAPIEGYKLSGEPPYGIVYTTRAQNAKFKYNARGNYKAIGFLTDRCFAGYNDGQLSGSGFSFGKESTNDNSMAFGQLEKILIDSGSEMILHSGTPLKLSEGYELAIESVDIDGKKVSLQLSKDGKALDSAVVMHSDNWTDTFSYSKNIGDAKDVEVLRVHLRNVFRGRDMIMVTVDSIWQASEGNYSNVVLNSSEEKIIYPHTSLKLEEGYELALRAVDLDGNKAHLELRREWSGCSFCSCCTP
jgi:S-layer protein (TIGR01567 family)